MICCGRIGAILCAYVDTTVFEDAMQQRSRSETSMSAVINAGKDTFISVRGDPNAVCMQATRNRVEQFPADPQTAVMAHQMDYWMPASVALAAVP